MGSKKSLGGIGGTGSIGATGANVDIQPISPQAPIQPIEPISPQAPIQPIEPIPPTAPIQPIEPIPPTAPIQPIPPVITRACRSIIRNYFKGTPNGIHVDPDSGLVWSPSHFTWMDTNYPACTPRVGYPVDIQALWILALKYLGYDKEAKKALASVKSLFKWEGHGYRDCLAAPNGEPASKATPEDTIRPNQLFLLTLGVLDDPSILAATEELLVPSGIRTLNSGHPLYRGVYAGDEDTQRKPAYHNGTVWAWPFPLYAEALVMLKQCKPEVALGLLAGAVESLNTGCIGHMSECADGDAPHAQKGCTAQAWSECELLRVWLKLGGR